MTGFRCPTCEDGPCLCDEPICGARYREWLCGEPPGHKGPHRDGPEACWRYTDEEPEPEDDEPETPEAEVVRLRAELAETKRLLAEARTNVRGLERGMLDERASADRHRARADGLHRTLSALVEALYRGDDDVVFCGTCDDVATREFAVTSGPRPCCDKHTHSCPRVDGGEWPVRELSYAEALRKALAVLGRG
jgi:hypothetical protein